MRVSGTKQRQIQSGMVGRKQRSPPQPSTTSAVSVAANLPPDLSSNAFDALRAARADDRLYVPLCLNRLERVINKSQRREAQQVNRAGPPSKSNAAPRRQSATLGELGSPRGGRRQECRVSLGGRTTRSRAGNQRCPGSPRGGRRQECPHTVEVTLKSNQLIRL